MRGFLKDIFGKQHKTPADDATTIFSAAFNHIGQRVFETRKNALDNFQEQLSNITAGGSQKPSGLAKVQLAGLHHGLGVAASELILETRLEINGKYRQKIDELGIRKEVEQLIDQEITERLTKVLDEVEVIFRAYEPDLQKRDETWCRNNTGK